MQPSEERAARQTRRDYCRGCSTSTPHPFHAWVTSDGHENTIRPRAYYRSCSSCGLVVMVLGDVSDAEGLARAVLDERLRQLGGAATAISPPVGPPPLDWEAGLYFLLHEIWQMYERKWDPSFGDGRVTFRSLATGRARQRLASWIQDESGEASDRTKGRVHPKAHAASVSSSYDALRERTDSIDRRDDEHDGAEYAVGEIAHDHGGLDEAGRLGAGDLADDRSPDLARALATPSRR